MLAQACVSRMGDLSQETQTKPEGQIHFFPVLFDGKQVSIRFRGLRNLDVIHEPLEDGCEITFSEKLGLSEEDIKARLAQRPSGSIPANPRLS